MFLVGLISWWYGDGLRQFATSTLERLARTFDFFSIDILVTTLFAPFRQISAGKVSGDVGSMFRGFIDKLISRAIGFMIRFFTLIAGIIWLVVQAAGSVVVVIGWAVLPLIPALGFILMALGWTPAWQ